ncbi:hypothetical protein GOHSU_18_01320 [Gordonia hirsuta DSM 44140 = NBRC 16056]|uniref:Uncharacterized protein n=1 Tax=Gordonia hirsuta DSM 44140 = NBRC 16056 TaxID=1121927 RepID=L7LBD6_9ACTN|nr:hypothetical protein GOHSU_18_01320 [Gordonia hirsuta DSM 44140 = NBRC 16056]
MNRHRPRKPRSDGAALGYLKDWQQAVEQVEQASLLPQPPAWWSSRCPCCSPIPEAGLEARDRLETLQRRAGRRAHRLRVALGELDERYLEVTVVDSDAFAAQNWWRRRRLPEW